MFASSRKARSAIISLCFFVCASLLGIGATVQSASARARSADGASAAAPSSSEAPVSPSSTPLSTSAPGSAAPASSASSTSAAPVALASSSGSYSIFPGALFELPPAGGQSDEPPVYGPAPLDEELAARAAEEAAKAAAAERQSVLAGNQVVAFYGKPGARSMGILGEYPIDKAATLLEGYARLYDEANGALGVVPAFYIIFGTCWPEGEIGYLRASVVEEYVRFAAERGWVVFLDHQIGKYTVADAMSTMLPYLRFPNVHLALDPEWRTLLPMKEIGSITGDELNAAQGMMNDYLRDNKLPGVRTLVVHQFRASMIRSRERIAANYDRVVLVHTADGFGPPALKRQSYAYNALATNMPVKGFKLFFESKVVGAGWDAPLMTPKEVLSLQPMPMVVMYQ